MTFDDGFASVFDHAWPAVRRAGLPIAVFLVAQTLAPGGKIVDWVDDPPPWPLRTMAISQVLELRDGGVTIGSHSYAHRDLTALGDAECERDLRDSRELLEEVVGAPVDLLAYPRGPERSAGPTGRRARRLSGGVHAARASASRWMRWGSPGRHLSGQWPRPPHREVRAGIPPGPERRLVAGRVRGGAQPDAFVRPRPRLSRPCQKPMPHPTCMATNAGGILASTRGSRSVRAARATAIAAAAPYSAARAAIGRRSRASSTRPATIAATSAGAARCRADSESGCSLATSALPRPYRRYCAKSSLDRLAGAPCDA